MCLLFYLKKPKNYQSGPQPVYLRITIDEKRAELSLGRECEPHLWSRKANRASGKSEFCRTLNAFIDQFQFKIYDAYEFLERHDEEISAEDVKDKFLGKKKIGVKIIEVYKKHNQKVEALVGKDLLMVL